MVENIWRRNFFCRGEEKRRRKWREIFGEGKYLLLQRRRKRRNVYFCGGEEERRRKIFFCVGIKERNRKRRKIFGEGKCQHGGKKNEQRLRKDRATQQMNYGRLKGFCQEEYHTKNYSWVNANDGEVMPEKRCHSKAKSICLGTIVVTKLDSVGLVTFCNISYFLHWHLSWEWLSSRTVRWLKGDMYDWCNGLPRIWKNEITKIIRARNSCSLTRV